MLTEKEKRQRAFEAEKKKECKAFKAFNEKLQNLEGSHGLIHAEWDYSHNVVYPAYGFSCGVNGNRLEHVESFAKALKKAVSMCKNFKYNGMTNFSPYGY